MDNLKDFHSDFKGNREDLIELSKLVKSPIRSSKREKALEEWVKYKKNKQIQKCIEPSGRLTKGGYISSLSTKTIDLRGANFDNIILGYVDMRAVILDGASMRGVWMKGAQFQDASLRKVDFTPSEKGRETRLMDANFNYCDLSEAKLNEADLTDATFKYSVMEEVDLTNADLSNTIFIKTNLEKAILSKSRIYGISAWDINKEEIKQDGLLIEQANDLVSVDDLEIAQFIYLMLDNKNLTSVISTIGKKAVLILGRFTPKRKLILDAIRKKLREEYDLIPIVFDFKRAEEKDLTETIKVLAGLSRFVIADITEPKSIPLELQAIIPDFMIPFVTIIQEGEKPFSMFKSLLNENKDRVLLPLEYPSLSFLLNNFKEKIIDEALKLEKELLEIKMSDKVEIRQ